MANIQFFSWLWRATGGASLKPGGQIVASTSILLPNPRDTTRVSFSVTARALTPPYEVQALVVQDLTVVTNSTSGANLNYRIRNTHTTTDVWNILVSYCMITE